MTPDTRDSDFVVGQIQAAQGADRYLLDQVRDRLDLPRTLLAVRHLSGQWPNAYLKLVEDKANGPAVVQSLRHEIGGLVEVNPEGGKISRAAAASPNFASHGWDSAQCGSRVKSFSTPYDYPACA